MSANNKTDELVLKVTEAVERIFSNIDPRDPMGLRLKADVKVFVLKSIEANQAPSRNTKYSEVMPGPVGHQGLVAVFPELIPPQSDKRAAIISNLRQLSVTSSQLRTDEAFAYFHRDPSRNPEYQQVMPGAAGHPGVVAAFTKPPPPPAGKRAELISDLRQLADDIQLSHRAEYIDVAIEMLSADAQSKPVFVPGINLDLDDLNKVLIDYRAKIARLRARIAVLDPVFSDAEGYQL